MKRTVAVFFGGRSAEREVSVLTGVLALRLIDRERYDPVPVYVHTDGEFYTSKEAFSLETFQKEPFSLSGFYRCRFAVGALLLTDLKRDRVRKRIAIDEALNCCHGGSGENGGVSAICEAYAFPSASPNVAACAVCMDKEWTKRLAAALSLPTLPYEILKKRDYVMRGNGAFHKLEALSFPLIVKPASQGSSVGIRVIDDKTQLKSATEEAFLYGDKLVYEPYLRQKEDVNCAAYRSKGSVRVSEPEIAFSGGVYTFEQKYMGEKQTDAAQENECALTESEKARIKEYTKTLYKSLDSIGIVRVDYLRADGNIYLGEVNAVPGSLAYYLFCDRLVDAKKLLTELLEEPFFGAGGDSEEYVWKETGVLKSVSTGGKRGFRGVRV